MVFPNPIKAAAALYRVARLYFRGDDFLVSGRVAARRRQICNQCPRRDPKTEQCLECSCFLSLKTELVSEDCPLSKWPE